MKKIIFIAIILLLQSFPSFGQLNGKGLMCECADKYLCSKKEYKYPYPIFFENNTFYYFIYQREKDFFKITKHKGDKLNTDENNIYLNNHILDRKTLIMKHSEIYYDKGINNFKYKYYKYKCDIFSQKDFNIVINAELKFIQSQYDKKRKSNKL